MKVIILAGGRATRLPRSAANIPKALVEIHGRTILDHQLDSLAGHGFKDVRLALGFRAQQVIVYLGARGRVDVEHVVEPEPLGTGGALRFATRDLREPFLVLNGDTLADFDFSAMVSAHRPGSAVMVSHWCRDASDFGFMDVADGRIRSFHEKPAEPRAGFINAGCYLLEPRHLENKKEGHWMLETDLFPRLASAGLLLTFEHKGFWQDVGTENRLSHVRNNALPRPWLLA